VNDQEARAGKEARTAAEEEEKKIGGILCL
jgi:hypothetical protein